MIVIKGVLSTHNPNSDPRNPLTIKKNIETIESRRDSRGVVSSDRLKVDNEAILPSIEG
jgi:hypothetical protein